MTFAKMFFVNCTMFMCFVRKIPLFGCLMFITDGYCGGANCRLPFQDQAKYFHIDILSHVVT